MAMERPHEEQKRTFSEDTAPHPEQLTIGRIVSHRAARQGSLMAQADGSGNIVADPEVEAMTQSLSDEVSKKRDYR